MAFLNLTPHAIVLNDGRRFPASGFVARVSSAFEETAEIEGVTIYRSVMGEITCTGEANGLPPVTEGTFFIVSAMVLDANNRLTVGRRYDLVAPSTGHSSTVRNEAGHIVSVGGFVV